MSDAIGREVAAQLGAVVALIADVLGEDAVGAYLHGSAVASGLRPRSDLDIFVVAARSTTHDEKQTLSDRLMAMSGPRAARGPARHLEVTIVARSAVRPWRYPPELDFQYGDWFRGEYERGNVEPWDSPNPDLAVLITIVLQSSRTLFGPAPAELLDQVPRADLEQAMRDGVPGLLAGLDGDEANVLLTFARIWATLATGKILAKDAAADWALRRLPQAHRAALERARGVYLGEAEDEWDDLRPQLVADAEVVIAEIERVRP
jgi:streptomycin 3"-adenylyltransferase